MKFSALIAVLAASFAWTPSPASAGTLHVFTTDAAGFNTHSVWYDDGREVTVVDTQFTPAYAESLLANIRQQTTSPVTRIIVTHPNPDKFNGLSVFHREKIDSIASVRTAAAMPGVDAYKRHYFITIAKMFTEETYPTFEPVKTTYTGTCIIRLKSGETITLFELAKPGISSDQTVVRIDKTGDLIVGDLVHTNNHAWLEGGIVDGKPVPTLAGWKADLRALPKLGHGLVYGGRGAFIPVKQAVAQQIAYLDKADALVDAYLRGVRDKNAPRTDHPAPAVDDAIDYKAIEAAFIKAFPDYAMPDLIGYSIYGLVQQKLAQDPGVPHLHPAGAR